MTGADILQMLIPTGGWVIAGDNFEDIQFNEAIPITKAQFEQGKLDYPAWKTSQDAAFTAQLIADAATKASIGTKLSSKPVQPLTVDEVAWLAKAIS